MAQDYDKIFKENIEELLPSMAKVILEIDPFSMEEIPDDLQHTIERRPDFLKKVHPKAGRESYILHLEFHVKDEEMVKREFEYYGMLFKEYGLEVRQVVLFFGSRRPKMATGFEHANVCFRFELVYFKDIDYEIFIKSEKPEEVVLAILADFKGEKPEDVILEIAAKLKELEKGGLRLGKYLRQFEILSKLRKLQNKTTKILDSMAFVYDLETDVRYLQGIQKGIDTGVTKGDKERALIVAEYGLNKGYQIDDIMEMTDLSKKEILAFQKWLEEYKIAKPQLEKGLSLDKVAALTGFTKTIIQAFKKKLEKEKRKGLNGKSN